MMTTFDPRSMALAVVVIFWFIGTLGLFLTANSRHQSGIVYSAINLLFLVILTAIFGALYNFNPAFAVIFGIIFANLGLPIFLIKDNKRHKEYVERRRKEPVHTIKEKEPEVWDGPKIPDDPFQGDERLRALFEKDDWFTLMEEIKKLMKTAQAIGDKKSIDKYEYLRKWVTDERDRLSYEKRCAEEQG